MSLKQLVVRAGLAVLAVVGSIPLAATPAAAQFCEPWNGGSEIRCLSHVVLDQWVVDTVAGSNPTLATVTVQSRVTSGPVAFRYQLWNSICNLSGASEPAATATLQPGGSLHIDLHPRSYRVSTGGTAAEVPHQGGGLGFDTVVHPFVCTEYFLTACTVAGSPVHCLDVLNASVVEFPKAP